MVSFKNSYMLLMKGYEKEGLASPEEERLKLRDPNSSGHKHSFNRRFGFSRFLRKMYLGPEI